MIWLAIDADSREIVGVFVGDRSRQAAKRLWQSLPAVYPRVFGGRLPPETLDASALFATPISGKLISRYCPVNGIERLVRKQGKLVILSGSTTPCGKEWGA